MKSKRIAIQIQMDKTTNMELPSSITGTQNHLPQSTDMDLLRRQFISFCDITKIYPKSSSQNAWQIHIGGSI